MTEPNNRQIAHSTALKNAINELQSTDITERCRILDITIAEDGGILLTVFGKGIKLIPPKYKVIPIDPSYRISPVDRILALHYLLCKVPAAQTGNLISFRDLPGGQFYWEPFRARSVALLENYIGNNIGLLRKRLSRFTWEQVNTGDLGARIQTIGKVHVTLVYYSGDEEFSPAAELLFDSSIKYYFNTEDVAVIGGRICLELIKQD